MQVKLSTSLINWMSQPAYMVKFDDMTEVKESEEIKAKTKYLNLILASVCHEFRTPLNAMLANLE